MELEVVVKVSKKHIFTTVWPRTENVVVIVFIGSDIPRFGTFRRPEDGR
jgi:hypothetical protein